MEFEKPQFRGRPPVESYGEGGFVIGGGFRRGSLLFLADRLEDWPVAHVSDATPDSLAAVIAGARAYDFLLLGCGGSIAAPPAPLRAACRDAGLGLEFMDTGAACRTYNVLLAEQRRFAAALIAVE